MSADFAHLVDEFCASEWSFHPIDASFSGARGFDGSLPPADSAAASRERAALHAFEKRLAASAVPDDAGARLDARLMDAHIANRLRMLDERPLAHNPAWATGEVAFGIIALLLRDADRSDRDLLARVEAIPAFLEDARSGLDGIAIPEDWVTRATRECAAIERLLASLEGVNGAARDRASAAVAAFGAALEGREPADVPCGTAYFEFLMHRVHGFDESAAALEARAASAFDRLLEELTEEAARLDPSRTWRDQLAALAELGPDPSDERASYARWNARVLADADTLVSPAVGYGLEFREMPPWAAAVAGDLYFLPYRSPRAFDPGDGSVYWVGPFAGTPEERRRANNTAAVKMVHAVHHGSIGHHTQNAAARSSPARLARFAGTDCASAIAFLGAGTMVEGWACYAEDLMDEVPGFYSPAERLQLKYFELRNIGCCLGDLRLHTGVWSLEEMRAFYRDTVGFAPARIWNETTRNSMFPGSRIMYWTGTERIKAMRAASPLPAKAFHDRLLSFGSAPLAWISEELDRCA